MLSSDYKRLHVWNKAMELATEVYALTKKLPPEERFALSDQMRRASVSIPSNIAEGQARNNIKEFIQFLRIAKGSTGEIETQLLLSVRLKLLKQSEVDNSLFLCVEVSKMLRALIANLTDQLNKNNTSTCSP